MCKNGQKHIGANTSRRQNVGAKPSRRQNVGAKTSAPKWGIPVKMSYSIVLNALKSFVAIGEHLEVPFNIKKSTKKC